MENDSLPAVPRGSCKPLNLHTGAAQAVVQTTRESSLPEVQEHFIHGQHPPSVGEGEGAEERRNGSLGSSVEKARMFI